MRFWNRGLARHLASLALACGSARTFAAGGSYLVDDATIAPDGHCQLETWARAIERGAADITAVPACTFDNIEWNVTGSWRGGDGSRNTQSGVGAKWVSGDLDKDGHALGIAGGALWSNGSLLSESLYVPASVALPADRRWTLDINAGALRTLDSGWHFLTGVAVDRTVSERWHLIAEYAYVVAAARTAQFGARWSASENAEIDFVLGRSWDAVDESWFTLGLNVSF